MNRLHVLVSIVLLLTASSLTKSTPMSVTTGSLRWAQSYLAAASSPQKVDMLSANCAIEAYTSILAKYGPNSEAFTGLARSYMQSGDYTKAQDAYEKSLALTPNDSVYNELQTCITTIHKAEQIAPLLPNKHVIIQLRRFTCDNRCYWITVSGLKYPNPFISELSEYHHVTLSLVPDDLSAVAIIYSCPEPGINDDDEIDVARLFAVDIDSDGNQEAVLSGFSVGGDSQPSRLSIYRIRQNKLQKMFGGDTIAPIHVTDLNGDTKYEVIYYERIEADLCIADQPYWKRIYALHQGVYRLANSQFPAEYNDLYQTINDRLLDHPHDVVLLEYRNKIRSYRRQATHQNKH